MVAAPLYVDTEDNILAACQGLADVGFGDALVVAIDDGVLQQFIGVDHFGKFADRQEMVVHALDLSGPAGPGGGGDNEMKGSFRRFISIKVVSLPTPLGPESTTRIGRVDSADRRWGSHHPEYLT